jgi:hypothetical protein
VLVVRGMAETDGANGGSGREEAASRIDAFSPSAAACTGRPDSELSERLVGASAGRVRRCA